MARRRLSVAILFDEPLRAELYGLRRAVGTKKLDTLPPHVTLVPPVNVHEEELDAAADVVRAAAARRRPMLLTIGPPNTFLPRNPVLYLAVAGAVDELAALRSDLLHAPLARRIDHEFVPHLTLNEEMPSAQIEAALAALGAYRVEVAVDRVHLLEHGDDRIWRPIADAPFVPAAVRGRGGIEVSFEVSRLGTPAGRRLIDASSVGHERAEPVVVETRLIGEDDVVGVAAGAQRAEPDGLRLTELRLTELVVARAHRRLGIGARLVDEFVAVAHQRGASVVDLHVEAGSWQQAWYERLGWRVEALVPRWIGTTTYAQMVRALV